MAIQGAIRQGRPSVTLVHKGNIMKFTEGAFRDWGYEVAREEFAGELVSEGDLKGPVPSGKIVINDRIADSMFQQILTRTGEYSVLGQRVVLGTLEETLPAQLERWSAILAG